jgi:hypothetical protein
VCTSPLAVPLDYKRVERGEACGDRLLTPFIVSFYVHTAKGDNFSPGYLRINQHGQLALSCMDRLGRATRLLGRSLPSLASLHLPQVPSLLSSFPSWRLLAPVWRLATGLSRTLWFALPATLRLPSQIKDSFLPCFLVAA